MNCRKRLTDDRGYGGFSPKQTKLNIENPNMKPQNIIIIILSALSLLIGVNVRADVIQYLNFNITTFAQGATTDDGTNTVAAPPKVKHHNTADLLKVLAQDKNAQSNWPSNSFPAGAKLAVGDGGFFVAQGTNILVDVSDILNFTNGVNGVEVVSGKRADATDVSKPTTKRLQIGRITFDDTGITGGAGLKFYLQGLLSDSKTDSAVSTSNTYTETQTGRLTNGAGEGTDSDGDFVCTGTVTATGHGVQTIGPL